MFGEVWLVLIINLYMFIVFGVMILVIVMVINLLGDGV